MRIEIVGGGPAGLYLAILMKKLDPSHRVTLYERDGPDDTYGWGIVFSDQTMSYLEEADAPTHQAITRSFETWDNVDVVHRGKKVSIRGNRFSGIARVRFLNILQERCRDLGVDLHFRTNVKDIEALRSADLLVGADGANSLVRRTYQDRFRPQLAYGRNKYIWLGTHRLFHGLTLTFRQNQDGLFTAHSYKFDGSTSTFIVECVDDAWERARLGERSEVEVVAYLEGVFADDLQGERLLTNNFVRWLNFLLVRNACWQDPPVVLLGDALHTAHFSIGSGTKLALEDAIALAGCFRETSEVPRALARFEEVRKPVVDALQHAAAASLSWFEQAQTRMRLAPLALAYELMTRSDRIDREKLRRRDPAFVERYEAWCREHPEP
ncbi:MAG: FAD-dependent monooxygenase [Acidobacteriota bacterium]|jgi:anthraniloyl-CoA monooxygenase